MKAPAARVWPGVLDCEPAIGEKEISEAMAILEKYKSAKASLDKRIIDNEEWYKLGHWKQYGNRVMEGKRAPSTGWLFNSIANKHADAMDNYPEPNVLPRAQDDEETAEAPLRHSAGGVGTGGLRERVQRHLVAQAQAGYRRQGHLLGPALRGGPWGHRHPEHGLLMLYWEPGVEDIQDSANFFSLALADNDRLAAGGSAGGQCGQQRHHRGAVRQ